MSNIELPQVDANNNDSMEGIISGELIVNKDEQNWLDSANDLPGEGWFLNDKRIRKKVYMKDPQSPLRRFPCPYQDCSYVAKYRSNLWDHKKTHTGERPYHCTWPDCNMRFSQTHQLKIHQRSHTGERPYQCPWPGCDASFSQKPGLRSHELTHTGEKSFACGFPGCNWSFRLKGALTDHKRAIHENRKMNLCEWPGCGKRFLQQCHLKKHVMIHTNQKPFACDWPNCTYTAISMAYVNNHRRIHTGERKYPCNFTGCNKQFIKSSHLNRHVERCHSDKSQAKIVTISEPQKNAQEPNIPEDISHVAENENDKDIVESEQIVIEYSEPDNRIVIQNGNVKKTYCGQLVEDKIGKQYIIFGEEIISLQDFINDEQYMEIFKEQALE